MLMLVNGQFFITLWDELQVRAKRNTADVALAGGMSYEQVRDRTSSSVGSDEDGGILFDETISAYAARRKAAAEFLISAVVDSQTKAFKAYLSKPQWTTISNDATLSESNASKVSPLSRLLTHV